MLPESTRIRILEAHSNMELHRTASSTSNSSRNSPHLSVMASHILWLENRNTLLWEYNSDDTKLNLMQSIRVPFHQSLQFTPTLCGTHNPQALLFIMAIDRPVWCTHGHPHTGVHWKWGWKFMFKRLVRPSKQAWTCSLELVGISVVKNGKDVEMATAEERSECPNFSTMLRTSVKSGEVTKFQQGHSAIIQPERSECTCWWYSRWSGEVAGVTGIMIFIRVLWTDIRVSIRRNTELSSS